MPYVGHLRLIDIDDAAVAVWAEKIRAQAWDEAYCFFKHEDAGSGPKLAAALTERFGAG